MFIIVPRDNASRVIEEMERGSRYKLCEEIEGYKDDNVGLMFYEVEENEKMKKTFSIVKNRLDLRKLDEKIEQFKREKGYAPYIFISEASLDEFEGGWGYVKLYTGCRVYKDESKKFGEIELR